MPDTTPAPLGQHQQAAVRQLLTLAPAAQAELQAHLAAVAQATVHRRGAGRGFAPSPTTTR